MKFTKENVIKAYSESIWYAIEDDMSLHDDFVTTINNMEVEEVEE